MVKALSLIGALPFKFDSPDGNLLVDFHCWCKVLCIWSIYFTYIIIIIPTQIYESQSSAKSIFKLSFTLLIWCFGVCATIILGVMVKYPAGVCRLLNASYTLIRSLPKIYTINCNFDLDRKRNTTIERLMTAVFMAHFSVGILSSIDCLLRHNLPPYLLFGVESRLISWPIRVMAWSLHFYLAVSFGALFGFVASNAILCFAYFTPIIKNEMKMGRKLYKTVPEIRHNPATLITTWKTMEALEKMANLEIFCVLIYIQAL